MDIKIYRNNKYDLKENLKVKVGIYLPILVGRIDNFFVNH